MASASAESLSWEATLMSNPVPRKTIPPSELVDAKLRQPIDGTLDFEPMLYAKKQRRKEDRDGEILLPN